MSFHNYEGHLLLTKLRRWRPTTHRYYCVLDQQQLTYYAHHHDPSPRGTIDLLRYTVIAAPPPTSPSRCFFSSNNSNPKTPRTQSFQLIGDHPDLPDFTFTAHSARSKDDWLEALSSRHLTSNTNTVLEKWLERFELSPDNIVSSFPSPPISPTPSTTSSASSVVAVITDRSQDIASISPSTFRRNLIARQKSSPALSTTLCNDLRPSKR